MLPTFNIIEFTVYVISDILYTTEDINLSQTQLVQAMN